MKREYGFRLLKSNSSRKTQDSTKSTNVRSVTNGINDSCSTCDIILKWRIRAKIRVTMNNGGLHHTRSEPITIRRNDVERIHDYARSSCCPRDYLLIRLPMKIGLRTGEISTLHMEDIDFTARTFYVLDSKRKEKYPLPLDMLTLQLIQDLNVDGYVFCRLTSWRYKKKDVAMTVSQLWYRTRQIGLAAGVKKFNPRLLRAYFAAHWLYVEHKSMATLQEILRHKDPATTMVYAARLRFFEDIQREFESTQNSPLVPESSREVRIDDMSHKADSSTSEGAGETVCNDCANVEFCKFAPLPACAEGCRFFKPKQEELNKL